MFVDRTTRSLKCTNQLGAATTSRDYSSTGVEEVRSRNQTRLLFCPLSYGRRSLAGNGFAPSCPFGHSRLP
ncbi:hypothetical protein VTI28DRAFT_9356 [Corynascus sepedonium]